MRPESKREQLLTQSVGDELVIYDERTHEAHHLSQTAAHVWQLADGTRDLPDLASALRESLGHAVARDTVTLDDETSLELTRLALSELDRAGLLARGLPDLSILGEPISRRQMLGVTAALLPVVASIVAPTPAMAATCNLTVTANPTTVVPAGGPVLVTINTSCPWTATSLEGFITPQVATGVGTGSVTFNVGANPLTTPRTGSITIGAFGDILPPKTITINQQGATGTTTTTTTTTTIPSNGTGSGPISPQTPQ